MESHSHTDDIITLPNDSQSGTQATSSSHLFVECPGICKRRVDLEKVNLARESRSRTIWNCSSCRQIKKKQIKISWYNLVCVQCTHTHGKTCLIQTCARNCPTKRALDIKKDLGRGSKRDPMSKRVVECPGTCKRRIALESIDLAGKSESSAVWTCSSCSQIQKKHIKFRWYNLVCVQCTHTHGDTCLIKHCTSNCPTRTALERLKVASKFERTFKAIESLKEPELVERLTVIRTAWMLGNGRMHQPWCRLNRPQFWKSNRKHLMSMLHSGFQAIAAKRSVRLPAGFCDDMADNFHFDNCMTRLQKESTANRIGFVFNYKNEFYQDVKHFCNNYNGLKKSAATADVVNTNFPNSAYLVVPGRSIYNYRHIPAAWKNGKKDLSTLKGAAYILGQREKPAGTHLLLVAHEQLKRTAASALSSCLRQRKRLRFMHRSNDQENGSGEDKPNV